ncbi:MAG: bifunctional folylpolyglutamate synthase/dihydrofolate synthase [Chitinophagaceae bacterium]|nr:bifunctional folylpolyglutamate synthase/dihydrofolate synthase [Chitinophagaceae bacterium]
MNTDALYEETIQKMYTMLPMFTRVGAAAYKPDLSNTLALCEALGNPQNKFKSIHIAGTNGKGSCSHMLASVFQLHGLKTGLYTSPHISDFRERIRIDGNMIDKQAVIDFMQTHADLLTHLKPSFFEVCVAMAFLFFAEQEVDIAIVEVGMGGLLDSTNVITPEVSVITNISKDHTQWLGETLSDIAIQKAGIIKKGVPVVIGESNAETEKVFFSKSVMMQSPIFYASQYFAVAGANQIAHLNQIRFFDLSAKAFKQVSTDLLGAYQAANVSTVLTTLRVMTQIGWLLNESLIEEALTKVKTRSGMRGRFDIIQTDPLVVLDVSHNQAGIQWCIKQFAGMDILNRHVILSFVADKDIDDILKLFPQNWNYIFTQADIPRALPHQELMSKAHQNGLHGKSYPDMESALSAIYPQLKKGDALLVTGSFFTLDNAYRWFELNKS